MEWVTRSRMTAAPWDGIELNHAATYDQPVMMAPEWDDGHASFLRTRNSDGTSHQCSHVQC